MALVEGKGGKLAEKKVFFLAEGRKGAQIFRTKLMRIFRLKLSQTNTQKINYLML